MPTRSKINHVNYIRNRRGLYDSCCIVTWLCSSAVVMPKANIHARFTCSQLFLLTTVIENNPYTHACPSCLSVSCLLIIWYCCVLRRYTQTLETSCAYFYFGDIGSWAFWKQTIEIKIQSNIFESLITKPFWKEAFNDASTDQASAGVLPRVWSQFVTRLVFIKNRLVSKPWPHPRNR